MATAFQQNAFQTTAFQASPNPRPIAAVMQAVGRAATF